ncbi:ketohexokinase [Biomphalaria glabrata]|nr:ketohexokinase-like [Biomphalaria glabrata]KAI8752651.1 ketohexokinase [Biomphalaria glabrata]
MEQNFYIQENKRVLFIGLACVDLFQILQSYPIEDMGHRCTESYWQRGGNAGNSATVFAILGGLAEYFGTLAIDKELQFIQQDFQENNVVTQNCVLIDKATCPLSVVIISLGSQSRTVLHTNKNLPELTIKHFQQKILQPNLSPTSLQYGWIHFEGRDNACEIAQMIRLIRDYNIKNQSENRSFKPIIVSLEAEKLRLSAELIKHDMWKLPDVMFISKDFAKSEGFLSMADAMQGFFPRMKEEAVLICAWGEEGAAAMSAWTGMVFSAAYKPQTVVDTCGAGDTFLSATILALTKGRPLKECITFGCQVAGAKCGMQGFQKLKEKHFQE